MLLTENKRRFPRISLRAPVQYQVRGENEFAHAVSADISQGGIRLVENSFIRPNTFLNLEINVLSQAINAIGRVAWSNAIPHSYNYQTGVEFIEISEKLKNYLGDYINMQIGKL